MEFPFLWVHPLLGENIGAGNEKSVRPGESKRKGLEIRKHGGYGTLSLACLGFV
jgi:hypothetical protein